MRRGISSASIALVALMAAAMLQSSAAKTYFVGNTTGWKVPDQSSFYSTWASQYTFAVGDVLVFNYITGRHDVARVTKANYDSCNPANPIFLQTTSPTNFTLNATGNYYFICTFDGHCSSGQKLAISISAGGPTASPPASPPTSKTPAPAPTPSGTSTPPPSSSPAPTPSGTSTPPPSSSPATPPPASSPASPPSGTTSPPPPPGAPSSGSPAPGSASTQPPPPPPPSAAPPKTVAAFTAVFMSIAVGLLY